MATLFDRHRDAARPGRRGARRPRILDAFPGGSEREDLWRDRARMPGSQPTKRSSARPSISPPTPNRIASAPSARPGARRSAITYPAADAATLVAASEWPPAPPGPPPRRKPASASCLEALVRLNAMSFEMGNAVMHTTGQAFAMAFQAGGPHAQDRGLEAVANAWAEMSRAPAARDWEKPQGKAAPLVIEKQLRVVPRGVALVIACATFPTWNSYPGLFASLATGNTVIVKPHPGAILPLALTVARPRDVLAEEGLPRDVVLLAADTPEAPVTKELPPSRGRDRRLHRLVRLRRLAARERRRGAGLHRGGRRQLLVVASTDDFAAMCPNLAFSLALYCGQMCTAPQDIFVPRGGIDTDEGPQVLRRGRRRPRRRGRRAAGGPGARRRRRPAPSRTPRRSTASPPRAGSAAWCATARRSPRGAAPPRCSSPSTPPTRPPRARNASAPSPSSSPSPTPATASPAPPRWRSARARSPRALYDTDEARILARRRRLRPGGRDAVGQPDRRHLRQPERRLQRLPRLRRQSGRQLLPDRCRLRRRPLPRAMWRRPVAA